MPMHRATLLFETGGKGLVEITEDLAAWVRRHGEGPGLLHVFCRHTSCSLMVMENADPSARRDLEAWLERLVPENDPLFRHTLEGPDDMPAHVKMALTRTSETIPVEDGRLVLGTWQGVFLWEHRRAEHRRELVLTLAT